MERVSVMLRSRRVLGVLGLLVVVVLVTIVVFVGSSPSETTVAAASGTTDTVADGSSPDGSETTGGPTADSVETVESTQQTTATDESVVTAEETSTSGQPPSSEPTADEESDATDDDDPADTNDDDTTDDTPPTSEVELASQTVTWEWVIEDKEWGDPDVTVSARASSGGQVTYSTSGDQCTVGANSGVVSIDNVGTCAIVATQPGTETHGPATATLSFAIAKASPIITFDGGSVRFARGNPGFSLWAASNPAIPLVYTKVSSELAYNDDVCGIDGTQLRLADLIDGGHPPLAATCAISVSAATTSPNYETPAPIVALIDVNSPSRSLTASADTTSAAPGETVTLTFLSPEGNVYAVDIWAEGPCQAPFEASPGYPSPVGTTRYTATVTIDEDAEIDETCEINGEANPTDHSGTVYTTYTSITIADSPQASLTSPFVALMSRTPR